MRNPGAATPALPFRMPHGLPGVNCVEDAVRGALQQPSLVNNWANEQKQVAPVLMPPCREVVVSRPVEEDALLWSLECTAVELSETTSFNCEECTICHYHDQKKELFPAWCHTGFSVGRLVQVDFFQNLLPAELSASVSREHFHIWALRVPTGGDVQILGIPCRIFLSNSSTNGTMVNDAYLRAPGEKIQIHHGDIIAVPCARKSAQGVREVVPLVSFSFSLSGSMLRDHDAIAPPEVGMQTNCGATGIIHIHCPYLDLLTIICLLS